MKTNRRTFLAGVSTAAVFSAIARGVCAEEIFRRRERHRDQDRQHQSVQRAGIGLRRDRQDDRGLLEERQRGRRHQRPQDQLHHPGRRLLAAQDRGVHPPARRAGQGAVHLQHAGHAVQHGDPQVHEPEKGADALRRHRRLEVGQSQGVPVDDGLSARLPHRSRHLRQAHPGQRQGRQDRRADAERRLRQGLLGRLQGGPRQGSRPCRQACNLRNDGSDGRFADHPAQGLRRQRLLQHRDSEVRGPGHAQGGRPQLEAGPVPEQRLARASLRP